MMWSLQSRRLSEFEAGGECASGYRLGFSPALGGLTVQQPPMTSVWFLALLWPDEQPAVASAADEFSL